MYSFLNFGRNSMKTWSGALKYNCKVNPKFDIFSKKKMLRYRA